MHVRCVKHRAQCTETVARSVCLLEESAVDFVKVVGDGVLVAALDDGLCQTPPPSASIIPPVSGVVDCRSRVSSGAEQKQHDLEIEKQRNMPESVHRSKAA